MEALMRNFKGFLYAFILFILTTLILSVIVKFTPAPEGWSLYYMIGVLCISCFFLGLYMGNHLKKNGVVYGSLYSIIFILMLSAFYMLAFSKGLEPGLSMLKYLIPVFFGSVGGMIGVNMRN